VQDLDTSATAVEGLARLALHGRLSSASVVSRLLVIWFNPATRDNASLRNCLAKFLPVFARQSLYVCQSNFQMNIHICRYNRHILADCISPCFDQILKAPRQSFIADIDLFNIGSFIISLTAPEHKSGQKPTDDNEELGVFIASFFFIVLVKPDLSAYLSC
jgi:condensin complex subunit 3